MKDRAIIFPRYYDEYIVSFDWIREILSVSDRHSHIKFIMVVHPHFFVYFKREIEGVFILVYEVSRVIVNMHGIGTG